MDTNTKGGGLQTFMEHWGGVVFGIVILLSTQLVWLFAKGNAASSWWLLGACIPLFILGGIGVARYWAESTADRARWLWVCLACFVAMLILAATIPSTGRIEVSDSPQGSVYAISGKGFQVFVLMLCVSIPVLSICLGAWKRQRIWSVLGWVVLWGLWILLLWF